MAKKGETVVVHYRGVLKNGKEFDTSEYREPLLFVIGSGSMLPGFEKAVRTMKVGEVKTVTIKAAEAYGPVRKELIMEIQRDKLQEGMNSKAGDKLRVNNSRGQTVVVKVVKATDTSITVDGNHELAGEDLTFTLKLMAIRK
jgi:peptidylprolyl isomerase